MVFYSDSRTVVEDRGETMSNRGGVGGDARSTRPAIQCRYSRCIRWAIQAEVAAERTICYHVDDLWRPPINIASADGVDSSAYWGRLSSGVGRMGCTVSLTNETSSAGPDRQHTSSPSWRPK